jgi:solute:Na+ symporter, SSS family
MGAATLVYTYFGGIRAVVWMDGVQMLIYMGGASARSGCSSTGSRWVGRADGGRG